MIDVFDLQEQRDIAQDPLKEFYHALLKKHVVLVDSPFVLQRMCMSLYKHHGFDEYFDVETLDEIFLELLE